MSWTLKSVHYALIGSLLLGASAAKGSAAPTSEVADPVLRAAIEVRQADKAVLLGATANGNGRIVAVGERGLVIFSDDQGGHWRQASVPVSVTLTAVRFASARDGVAVGHGAVVLTTEDGGETWGLRLEGRHAAELALAEARRSGDQLFIDKAQLLVDDGPDKPFLDLAVGAKGQILVVGAFGMLFESPDFGKTWSSWMTRLDNAEGFHLYCVRQRGQSVLIAGERGLVLRSDDAGQHFSRLKTPYDGSFFTSEQLADGSIVLAGLKGNLLHGSADGQSWKALAPSGGASYTGSSLGADGTLYLVTQAGQLMAWKNNALAQINPQALPALNGVLPIEREKFVLLSNLGVSTLAFSAQAEGKRK